MSSKLHLNADQTRSAAACIIALRELPAEERLDVIVLLAKAIIEDRVGEVLFPDGVEPAHGTDSRHALPR